MLKDVCEFFFKYVKRNLHLQNISDIDPAMESTFVVEKVEATDEDVYKEFRKFTHRIVGRGLSIPDSNDVFFGYKIVQGWFVEKNLLIKGKL